MSTYISYSDAIHLFDNVFIEIPIKLVDSYEPEVLLPPFEHIFDMEYFQVCLSDIKSEEYVNILTDLFPDVHLKYFELLEGWVLCVQHSGTSWNCVDIPVNVNSKYFEKLFSEGSSNRQLLKFTNEN